MDVTKPLPRNCQARPRSNSKEGIHKVDARANSLPGLPVAGGPRSPTQDGGHSPRSPRSPLRSPRRMGSSSSIVFLRQRSNSKEYAGVSPPRSPGRTPGRSSSHAFSLSENKSSPSKGSGPLRMSSSMINPSPRFASNAAVGSLPSLFCISKMSKDIGQSPEAYRAEMEKALLVLLTSMDRSGDKMVDIQDLQEALMSVGLHPRLVEEATNVIDQNGDGNICFEEILQLKNRNNRWIFNALIGDLSIRDHVSFTSVLNQCYEDSNIEPEDSFVAACNEGLPEEKYQQFGAAFCSVDGQHWHQGEAHEKFTLQEASFPIMYCKAIELVGAEEVHSIIGREPRGQGTSEYTMDKFGKPHNPLISLGAIATASLIHPEEDLADRFKVMTGVCDELTAGCGGNVTFDNFNYLKASESAVKEYSLAYGAKEKHTFPGVKSHECLSSLLRFHFMCEAIEMDCTQLSIAAATLARGGINPISRKRVFSSETAQHCLSVLFSCGLKELTGAFAFEIGLPAKCGSSGVIMCVIPGVGGFAFHSPLVLEENEISMKGITFCHELISHFPLHIFDSESTKLDQMSSEYAEVDVYQLIYSAANGDLATVKKLLFARGADVNSSDYDERTALHLAVAEKRGKMIKFLLEQGAFVRARDRWGRTPLDEAKGTPYEEMLESFDIQIGL